MYGTFPSRRNVILWHLRPVANISTKRQKIWYTVIQARSMVAGAHHVTQYATNNIYVGLHVKIKTKSQTNATLSVCFQGPWIIVIETHGNIVEQWCSMTVDILIQIVMEKSFQGFFSNLTSKGGHLPKFKIVGSVANSPTYIVHMHDDETLRLVPRQENVTNRDKTEIDIRLTPFNIGHRNAKMKNLIDKACKKFRGGFEQRFVKGTDDTGGVFCILWPMYINAHPVGEIGIIILVRPKWFSTESNLLTQIGYLYKQPSIKRGQRREI